MTVKAKKNFKKRENTELENVKALLNLDRTLKKWNRLENQRQILKREGKEVKQ